MIKHFIQARMFDQASGGATDPTMTPWTLLDTAPIPDGGGRLRLLRRGSEYVIRLDDGAELMSSRVGGSEEALATARLRRARRSGRGLAC